MEYFSNRREVDNWELDELVYPPEPGGTKAAPSLVLSDELSYIDTLPQRKTADSAHPDSLYTETISPTAPTTPIISTPIALVQNPTVRTQDWPAQDIIEMDVADLPINDLEAPHLLRSRTSTNIIAPFLDSVLPAEPRENRTSKGNKWTPAKWRAMRFSHGPFWGPSRTILDPRIVVRSLFFLLILLLKIIPHG